MNDLLSHSFSGGRNGDIEIGNTTTGTSPNLDEFFKHVDEIKTELEALESLLNQLQSSNEHIKTLHNTNSIKTLKATMDNDVVSSITKAKLIKNSLEALDRSNRSNSGPGTTTDRTRTAVVNGLRNQLRSSMKSFNELRQRMAAEHRETVQRRYYTVTGENADEATVDKLISTGESETMLQKAIQEQGGGQVIMRGSRMGKPAKWAMSTVADPVIFFNRCTVFIYSNFKGTDIKNYWSVQQFELDKVH